jgi:hypothetical protein
VPSRTQTWVPGLLANFSPDRLDDEAQPFPDGTQGRFFTPAEDSVFSGHKQESTTEDVHSEHLSG